MTEKPHPQKIQVAAVGYTNAWPLTRYLDRARFEVRECVPSEAARRLRAGEADLGLIPVAALLSDGDYRVLPGYGIGCDGPVDSVLLVGERPLAEWDRVVLDGESRTSIILAQILLRGPLGRPDLTIEAVDPGAGLFHARGTTGAVLIGDAARLLPDRLTTRIDLGAVWKGWTDLPFVFAVWAARADLPADAVQQVRAAAEQGLHARLSAPEADRDYLTRSIRYQLDDRAMMGLRRFAALGRQAGLLGREEFSLLPPARSLPRADARPLLRALRPDRAAGARLSPAEAAALLDAPLDQLILAADRRRAALHPGGTVLVDRSGDLDTSARCAAACTFCTFASPDGASDSAPAPDHTPGAAPDDTPDPDRIPPAAAARLDALKAAGAAGVVLQGGLDPDLDLAAYTALIRAARARDLAPTGLSPDELISLAARSGLSLEDALPRIISALRDAGLSGLWGAGAEMLGPWRASVAPRKAPAARWLAALAAAHRAGLRGPATVLIGTGEAPADWISHLAALRDLQDQTGGLTGLLPLAWIPPRGLPVSGNTAVALLRITAIARLFLDNVPHILASWQSLGPGVMQAQLRGGASALAPLHTGPSFLARRATVCAPPQEIERHVRVAGLTPA